jgi:hypothetical protein
MRGFFPSNTGIWKLEEPPAFRRLSMSVVEVAAVTGVVLRLYRALVLTRGPTTHWVYVGATFAFGMLLLFGMVTLHLGNFTVRHWLWRAPAFAGIEAGAETVTSTLLILLGREVIGTSRAEMSDLWAIAADVFFWRVVGICLFALALAGVVQVVRRYVDRREPGTGNRKPDTVE